MRKMGGQKRQRRLTGCVLYGGWRGVARRGATPPFAPSRGIEAPVRSVVRNLVENVEARQEHVTYPVTQLPASSLLTVCRLIFAIKPRGRAG